jgi:hypothetical protein
VSCWLHMSRSVKGASGHTHGGEIRPVFGALLTSTLMRACALACLRACMCLRGGFVEKCEEAKHSPPRRAAEDAPVTAQHDVPRWARGRWRPAAVRLRGWAAAAAPGRIFTFTG